MSWLSRLFGRNPAAPKAEHAVVVHFDYGSTDLQPVFDLGDELQALLAKAGAGEYDGNEIEASGKDGFLYLYGPDADRLFSVIRPVLEKAAFMKGARCTLRYGPPQEGVREAKVVLAA